MRRCKAIAFLGTLVFLLAACTNVDTAPPAVTMAVVTPSSAPTPTESPSAVHSPEEALEILRDFISSEDIFVEVEDDKMLALRFKNSPNFVLRYDEFLDDERGQFYLFHDYEFVVDDPNTGEGHTVSYNWYGVNAASGTVVDMGNPDGSFNPDY